MLSAGFFRLRTEARRNIGARRCIYWYRTEMRRKEVAVMCGKNTFIGICALALGLGILITAIFPVGALLFVIAFLLIACGLGCMQR